MDMYNLLSKIDELQQLTESSKKEKTHKGGEKTSDDEKGVTKHKGKYGTSHKEDDDEDSKKSKSKKKTSDDEDKDSEDDSDKDSGKSLQDIFSKKPKDFEKKSGKKHTFKEWIDSIDRAVLSENPVPIMTKVKVDGKEQPVSVMVDPNKAGQDKQSLELAAQTLAKASTSKPGSIVAQMPKTAQTSSTQIGMSEGDGSWKKLGLSGEVNPQMSPRLKEIRDFVERFALHNQKQDYEDMITDLAGFKNLGDMLRNADGSIDDTTYNKIYRMTTTLERLGLAIASEWRNQKYMEEPRLSEFGKLKKEWYFMFKDAIKFATTYQKQPTQGVAEGEIKSNIILTEEMLREAFLQSLQQKLGNAIQQPIKAVINTKTALGVLYKIASNPQYLDTVTFELKRALKRQLTQIKNPALLQAISSRFPQGRTLGDFFKALILYALSKSASIATNLTTDQAVDYLVNQVVNIEKIVGNIIATAGGSILSVLKGLGIADKLFFEILTYIHAKIANAPVSQSANQGVAENSSQPLSVQQLAAISDEALDKAYGYGRSSPGNTFGWQANLMSASYAKKMIDAGITDIEKISDAIHKGWNVTAQKFVQNPDQFDDTEKLRQAGKLEAKLQQRAKLMKINYAQLDNEEQEKDRVVARALLQAIKGKQGMNEGYKDDVEESGLQAYLGKKKYGKEGMKALQKAGRENASDEEMKKLRAKHSVKEADIRMGTSASPLSKSARKMELEEGYDRHMAAFHEGKAHAMEGGRYSCRYDEGSDEHRRYHDGFKEGLDECYGRGVYEAGDSKDPVMDEAYTEEGYMSEYDLEEGNPFAWAAKNTPKGEKFTVGDKTFTKTEEGWNEGLDQMDEMEMDPMFESWDKQLKEYLSEGVTITTSTGQQGVPDNVSISASGEDANQLLQILNNSGMLKTGSMPKQGHLSPMTQVKGDGESDGSTNMAAVSVRSMPDGMGMSSQSDYEEETPVNEPYDFDVVQSALDDGGYDTDTSSSMLGSLSRKLMQLEAKTPIMPSPEGKGMSQPATEKPRKTPEPVSDEQVEQALAKDGKKVNPKVKVDGKKSIYTEAAENEDTSKPVKDPNPNTPVLGMPAAKGMSTEPTEKPDELVEPTSQDEVVDALGKDAKKQGEVEFNALKALLDKQNMMDASKVKKTVKEEAEVSTTAKAPTENDLVLAMPYAKGFSTDPTEKEREAPEPFTVETVNDAIAKDAKKDDSAEDDFQALKKLISAHGRYELPNVKKDTSATPSSEAKGTSGFVNDESKLETKKPSPEVDKEGQTDTQDSEVEKKDDVSKLKEWANTLRNKDIKSSSVKEEMFTTDTEFMTKDISGGLNKMKVDQTTLPHTKVKVSENSSGSILRDMLKLCGLK